MKSLFLEKLTRVQYERYLKQKEKTIEFIKDKLKNPNKKRCTGTMANFYERQWANAISYLYKEHSENTFSRKIKNKIISRLKKLRNHL